MGATTASLARAYDGTRAAQLELGCQRTADGQAMVNVRGELDIATAEQAHAYLRRVVDGEKKGKITLNLGDLTFCDAAGLGVLAKVAGHARRTGRTLRVTAARPSLLRIMRITGMDEAFPEIRTPVLAMLNCPPPRNGTVSPG
jgi:anti-anti-sigma factor